MLIHLFEILGFISGALGVWFNCKENIWGWPLGILSVMFYTIVFAHYKLYADMGLQIIYIPLCLYGWYFWHKNKKQKSLIVFEINDFQFIKVATVFIIFTPLLGIYLEKYTDSDCSYLDASASGLSLLAEWMLAKKFIESWLLWMIADASFALIYYSKELYLTGLLYLVFTIMAGYGFFRWKNQLYNPI